MLLQYTRVTVLLINIIYKHTLTTFMINTIIYSQGCKFFGNLVLVGNFRKFSLIVNITDNRGTSVDLNETMHATPMSTINHENNVVVHVLLLVHRAAVKANRK